MHPVSRLTVALEAVDKALKGVHSTEDHAFFSNIGMLDSVHLPLAHSSPSTDPHNITDHHLIADTGDRNVAGDSFHVQASIPAKVRIIFLLRQYTRS